MEGLQKALMFRFISHSEIADYIGECLTPPEESPFWSLLSFRLFRGDICLSLQPPRLADGSGKEIPRRTFLSSNFAHTARDDTLGGVNVFFGRSRTPVPTMQESVNMKKCRATSSA